MDKQTQLLMAIYHNNNRASGRDIDKYLKEKFNVDMSIGGLYCALDKLFREGLASYEEGDPSLERGGRSRRYYNVTHNGKRIMNGASDGSENFDCTVFA